MKGYVVVQVSVEDPDTYARYRSQVPATVAKYGGRFLVRGGATESLEGTWRPERLVILEFESMEQARAWWHSEEYAVPRGLRQRSARTEMLLVEGV